MATKWYELLPSELRNILSQVSSRVFELSKTYGSLARAGRPPFESKEEACVVYHVAKNYASLSDLAGFLNVKKNSVWRWVKAIEDKHSISIYDPEAKRTVSVEVSPEECASVVEELTKPKAQKWLKEITDSKVIQEFIRNPLKIQKASKHGKYYTATQVKNTVKRVDMLARYILAAQQRIQQRLGKEVPSNPDLWDDEEAISTIIDMMCQEKYTEPRKVRMCQRDIRMALRRIPKFREWFKGEIGTVRQIIRPKEATLYYEHYVKLKKLALSSDDLELRAFWLVAGLHIWAGCREGWASIRLTLERIEASGAKPPVPPSEALSLDLDSPVVNSSLIGIKWSKAVFDAEGHLVGFRIWEEKTKKEWTLRFCWLDADICRELERVYQWAQEKGIDSVVKSILLYHGVTPRTSKILKRRDPRWTVDAFRSWYTGWVKRLKSILGLPWELNPHRLRSAHIAIGAELRIPMELFLQDTGFGVGWEDATTAVIFYLRFSQSLISDYLRQAEEIKNRLEQAA